MKCIFNLFFFLLIVLSQFALAQQNFKNINPNQLEISLYNGYAFNKVKPVYGPDKLKNAAAFDHNLMITYNRYLTEDFGISAGWGFGFHAFNYDIDSKDGFVGTENIQYRFMCEYNIYHKLEIKANYYLQLNRTDRLKFGIGGGLTDFLSSGLGISGENENRESIYVIRIDYPAKVNPVAVVSLDYVKPLRNKNELKLGLSHTYGFKNIYEGNYKLYSNTSGGEIYSRGTNTGINVSYVFTGNENRAKYNNRIDAGEDSKAAKAEMRKERRYLDPRSTFINIYAGTGFSKTKVNDPSGYIISSSQIIDKYFGFEYEHGIKSNFFISGGYHFSDYNSSPRIIYSSLSTSGYAVTGHEFTLGVGYRWITASNVKIINLYAGIVSGFTNKQKGTSSTYSGGYTQYYSGDSVVNHSLDMLVSNRVVSRVIAGAYIGASKDFRITDLFWISINYRYQQGFNPIVRSDITYKSTLFNGFRDATAKVDGTGHLISFGLKLRFR